MTPLRGLIALGLLLVVAGVFYVAVGGGETHGPSGPAEQGARPEGPEQVGGPGELPQVTLPGEAESAADSPAEVRAEVLAEGASKHRVFGRVIDEAGSPIEEAEVMLARRFGRRVRDAAEEGNSARRTDRDGRFLFEEVAPERGLTLCVRLERHAGVTREIPESLAGDLDLGNLVVELGGSLAGHVLDEARNPVAGAEVRAWHHKLTEGPNVDILFSLDLSGAGVRSTTADASGFFLLHGLPAGEAIALARADGYTSESVTGISIRKGGLTGDVTITLSSGGAIEGVVVEEATGRPIEGALVAVSDTVINISEPGISTKVAQNREVHSAADGGFRLAGLRRHAYHVTASKDRFVPECMKSVAPGTSNLRLALRPSGLLYGSVRDKKNGEPVADFTAAVRPTRYDSAIGYGPWSRGEFKVLRGKEAAEAAGVAENLGLFAVFCALPGAEFSLDITAESFPSCRIQPIRVESGARVQVDVELTPGIEVSGIVRDPRGNPVAGASVVVQRSKDKGHVTLEGDRTTRLGGWSHQGPTDEEGRFCVLGLAAGEYGLMATHAEWAPSDALLLELVEGEHVRDLQVTLRAGGTLEGTTYGADGSPLAGAWVTLKEAPTQTAGEAGGFPGDTAFGPNGGRALASTADGNGHYAIRGIRPGLYLATVQGPAKDGSSGHGMQVSIGDEDGDSGGSVTIEEGKTTTKDLHLTPTGALAGQVSAAGMPLPGASVWLYSKAAGKPFGAVSVSQNSKHGSHLSLLGGARDSTGEDGEFLFEGVKPAQYVLSVTAKGAARPLRREVEVRPLQTTRELIALPTGVIAGQVKDVHSGRGIPEVVITVRPARGDAEEETAYSTTAVVGYGDGRSSMMTFSDAPEVLTTDEYGCYEVHYLEPGDYLIDARGGGIVTMHTDQVRVLEGQRTDGVDFEATIGAVLFVRPRLDPGEDPPDRLQVTLVNEATKDEETSHNVGQPCVPFAGLSPGRYTVKLSAGDRSGELLVEVAAGEQKEVAVPLR